MEETKKVLQLVFATQEGGNFRITVGNTLDDLELTDIKGAMDKIIASKVFKTNKGEVVSKATARYVTQEIQDLDIAQLGGTYARDAYSNREPWFSNRTFYVPTHQGRNKDRGPNPEYKPANWGYKPQKIGNNLKALYGLLCNQEPYRAFNQNKVKELLRKCYMTC